MPKIEYKNMSDIEFKLMTSKAINECSNLT